MSGVTVIVPESVPPEGERLSQLALSDAVQLRVPPPALLTPIVFAAGLGPPAVPPNDRLAGVTESAGCVDPVARLNATVAISHGVLGPVETRAAGVLPSAATASSTSNS